MEINRTKILLVQPWNYHDEGRTDYNPERSWRNGPFNITLLATLLRRNGHDARVLDLEPILIKNNGNVKSTLFNATTVLADFRPDIVGVSFFSVHFLEVQTLMRLFRDTTEKLRISPVFIAGGIHASISPETCLDTLLFDYAFVGEGESAILDIASGKKPSEVQGFYDRKALAFAEVDERYSAKDRLKGQYLDTLDDLPFVDWGLVDYKFYSHPSTARLGFEPVGSLDLEMGRGCVYKCSFCAYNALSSVRFHSAEYIVENMLYNYKNFGVTAFYFTESTIGNNRKVIREMCEILIRRNLNRKFVWLANIRSNQISEKDLRLMWLGGCRYLFYGFESNSQRVLDLMDKQCSVDANETAAKLHQKLFFPYNASMLVGFPGEKEDDLKLSIDFIKRHKPPSVGINWYVPLPGSPDYDKLISEGKINFDGPEVWRRIGEVNSSICYADIDPIIFRRYYDEACRLANVEIPSQVWSIWRKEYQRKTKEALESEFQPTFRNVYSFIPIRKA